MAQATRTSPKEHFLDVLSMEMATTARVLRAYPDSKLDLKPHETSMSAKELAWLLARGHGLMNKALTTGFDWSKPPQAPPSAPDTLAEIVAALERDHAWLAETVRGVDESKLEGTIKFLVGPKKLGDMKLMDFFWFVLSDHVHHRGQFSVYLRMAGGKVPSIYGPSRDEPWM